MQPRPDFRGLSGGIQGNDQPSSGVPFASYRRQDVLDHPTYRVSCGNELKTGDRESITLTATSAVPFDVTLVAEWIRSPMLSGMTPFKLALGTVRVV